MKTNLRSAALCIGAAAAALFTAAILAAAAPQRGVVEHEDRERIAVVVNRQNPVDSLTVSSLRLIYLRQQTKWPNGWPIAVFERHSENTIRADFARLVLGMATPEVAEYWLNLQLTRGLQPPQVCRSARLVKEHLARTRGGIGYLFESELDVGVKRVRIADLD